jgi:hypothetical protein
MVTKPCEYVGVECDELTSVLSSRYVVRAEPTVLRVSLNKSGSLLLWSDYVRRRCVWVFRGAWGLSWENSGLCSDVFCSAINKPRLRNSCLYKFSRRFNLFPLLHGMTSCEDSSIELY